MAGRVRQPIDEEALARFVAANVPQVKTPIELKQFGFGQSNPTYQITGADGQRFVLRKKPPGQLLSTTAHKVEREYRVLRALEKTDVPTPKTYCLCEDQSVIGTPFYMMELLDGRIYEDPTMPDVSPEERTQMWRSAMETLARLHAVDMSKVGLDKFGKPGSFYNRQIQTWTTICARQETVADVETGELVGRLPHFDEMIKFFARGGMQPKDRATLVHGDYKIDNLIFHKTEPRVIGVIDWELSTIGHPLSDVCNLLMEFYKATHPRACTQATTGLLPGQTAGLPTPEQLAGWYTRMSGYDPWPELTWGMAFNVFKMAAVVQGITARQAARQASSDMAMRYAATREPLAELAWQLVQEASMKGGPRL